MTTNGDGAGGTAAEPPPYWRGEVVARSAPTPRTDRITFGGADLAGFPRLGADQSVKLFFPPSRRQELQLPPPLTGGDVRSWYRSYLAMPDGVRPAMRTFSVRRHHGERGTFDVDLVRHDDGAAQRWVRDVRVGDRVAFTGTGRSHALPADAMWQLLVGDETAVPAIGAIVESLRPGDRALVFADVADPGEELDWSTRGDVDTRWCHHGRTPGLLEAVRSARLPAGPGYAWVAGEAALVRDVRRHLLAARGFDRAAISFTGYWRRGASEEEASREAIEGTGPRDEAG